MGLQEYKRKRRFSVTPEPAGTVQETSGNSFIIQKHAATRLHYDFRLEMDGVLRSWAVPKGPSLDPGEKRLAVHVEDHPLEYGDFEGIIPKGEYGGGTVLLWDRGTWHPIEDAAKGYKKGHLHFRLEGEKLHGGWHLVRLHGQQAGENKQNWLLFKEDDEIAVPGSGDAVLQEYPASVATGRTIEEIAADPDRVWRSNREEKVDKTPVDKKAARPPARVSSVDPSKIAKARKGRLAGAVEPQLATPADEPPGGDEWLHELKFEGYRVLCEIKDGKVHLWTRDGKDWTDRFTSVAEAVARLPVRAALLDGEVAVLEPDGTTSLQALQNALTKGRDQDLIYFAFDLLHLDGYDLRGATLLNRKEALAGVLSGNTSPMSRTLRYSDHVQGSGEAFYGQACKLSIDGIISKRGDAPYRSGRGKDWLVITCLKPPGRAKKGASTISGVTLSNPDKVLFPEQGITKRDLAVYYERIADWILPRIADRPLTLVRCPEGRTGQCFYQKHVNEHFPKTVQRIQVEEEGDEPYGLIDSVEGLISLVQMGVLEMHIWGSTRKDIEKPDYVVFDLDPDEGLPWKRVAEGALLLRDRLGDLGLRSFLKTTGGKGLHVCVPLTRRAGWDEVKDFTRAVSESVVADDPKRYTSKMSKASRKGKIFIDYLRNGRGATSICAWSTRAREGAPVSTPLAWDEIESGQDVHGDYWNVKNVPERLESLKSDPWHDFSKVRQSITAAMKKAVGMK